MIQLSIVFIIKNKSNDCGSTVLKLYALVTPEFPEETPFRELISDVNHTLLPTLGCTLT